MDALTFGSSVLLRHLTFSEARFVSHKDFLDVISAMLLLLLRVLQWLMLILKLFNAILMHVTTGTKLVVAA